MLPALVLAAVLPSPDPYAILAHARSRWAAQTYPAFLSYTVTVSGVEGRALVNNTYQSLAETRTNVIHVHATSEQETAHPYVPRGVVFKTKVSVGYRFHPRLFGGPGLEGGGDVNVEKTVRVSKVEQYDLLGVPLLSPAYSFGLEPQAIAVASPPPGSASGLKTIALVTAARRDYDVRYVGMESVDGAPCYHLALTPLRDPGVFRLRELWIDDASYVTRQALVQGNFTAGPGPRLPWLVHFTVQDGLMYIADETALARVKYLKGTYTHVTIAFQNIQPSDAPDVTWSLSMFRTSGDVLKEP